VTIYFNGNVASQTGGGRLGPIMVTYDIRIPIDASVAMSEEEHCDLGTPLDLLLTQQTVYCFFNASFFFFLCFRFAV